MHTFFSVLPFFPLRLLILLAALAAVTAPAAAAPVPGQPSPVAVVARACTLQVREAWSVRGPAGGLEPWARVAVRIARPGRLRVETVPAASLFVSDGRTQHEYQRTQNRFVTAGAAPLGPDLDSQFGLPHTANLALLLPGPATVAGFRPAGRTRLGGRPTDLYTYPGVHGWVAGGARPGDIVVQKLWADPTTRLPQRLAVFVTRAGRTAEVQRVDFSDWKIDAPLAPGVFAWDPPAGATPYAAPRRLAAGTPAPDFQAQDRDGRTVRLTEFSGKVVVLDFWATWCVPCLQAMPATDALARRYASRGVVVLAVNVWDSPAHFSAWLGRDQQYGGLTFVIDPRPLGHGDTAADQYGIDAIPAQCVIGRDGRVVGYGGTGDEAEVLLRKALG